MNDEDIRWLGYDELARVLGIAPDSARRLVARRKWPRRPGNDGRARIGVPAERLPPDSPPDVAPDDGTGVQADVIPVGPPDVRDDITPIIRIMVDHIERLEKELKAVKAERDAECTRTAELAPKAAQVEALQAILETEKRRADELCTDRDRSRAHADRLEGELAELRPKVAEHDQLTGQLEALRAMLEQTRQERDAEHQKAAEHDILAMQVETLKVALEESRQERDRWAVQAHALAHPPVPLAPAPRPSRGLLGWFRAARR